MTRVAIRPMRAEDGPMVTRQPSQRMQLGMTLAETMTIAEAQGLIDGGEAWTAWRIDGDDETPVAMTGILETFADRQGVAWALLGDCIGAAHLAITRHAAQRIMLSPLVRIEAIVRAAVKAEVTWARLVGLKQCAVLRKFGAASEDHILFERIA